MKTQGLPGPETGVIAGLNEPAILEFGAGSGRLAVDVLRALAQLDALPERYAIIEVSADLRERQQVLVRKEVPELADRVAWLDRMPDRHTGIVIANEVLDALPVERFVRRRERVAQVCVTVEDDCFVAVERPEVNRDIDEHDVVLLGQAIRILPPYDITPQVEHPP